MTSPSFPTPTPSKTGFPEHRKRTKPSAFKKRRQAEQAEGEASSNGLPATRPNDLLGSSQNAESKLRSGFAADDSRSIDRENKSRIDSMSPQEIEAAQKEIFNAMDPSLIQRLLRRANLDEGGASLLDGPPSGAGQSSAAAAQAAPTPPAVVVQDSHSAEPREDIAKPATAKPKPKKVVTFDDDAAPPAPTPQDLPLPLPTNTTHFPKQTVPDLDPADPDFLANLHKKYFPNLPADPSKLAWMAPVPTPNSTADRESPYYPGQSSLPVSALRFDFRGILIPPRLSRQIPTNMGLHNHGEAPEAAGYTIPELARLARSAVPGQRCIAFQTLGRMLYRLGKGEWGIGEGGRFGEEDDLAFGLWRCFVETRVLDSLAEAASVEDGAGHMASKAYAVEALWLLEKGGWKEKWRGL